MKLQNLSRYSFVSGRRSQLSMAIAFILAGVAGQACAQTAAQTQPTPLPTQSTSMAQAQTGEQPTPAPAKKKADQNGQTPAGSPQTAAGTDTAQNPAELSGVSVTGYGASLTRAQEDKRSADTVIDAISASDMGALPDQSVLEALQRAPGVVISRMQIGGDIQHYSSQGTSFSLQGLSMTSTLINGENTFSAGGTSLDLSSIAPALISGIEIYKNQTADLVEGGISGTVNVNTRKPFDDDKDTSGYFHLNENSGELGAHSPGAAAAFEHKFDTDIGRFGIFLGGSTDKLVQGAQDMIVNSYLPRTEASGQTVYVPSNAGALDQEISTRRYSGDLTAQYETPDKKLQLTFTAITASQTIEQHEHGFGTDNPVTPCDDLEFNNPAYVGAGNTTRTNCVQPVAGYGPWQFDNSGRFVSGTITAPPGPDQNYNFAAANAPGLPMNLTQRQSIDREALNNFSLGAKWQAFDQLRFDFDGQFMKSNTKDELAYSTTTIKGAWDINLANPGSPIIQPLSPVGGSAASWYNNPNNYYWGALLDNRSKDVGYQRTFRADGTFDFASADSGFLKDFRFGYRYSDRSENLGSTTFNYAPFQPGPCDLNHPPAGGCGPSPISYAQGPGVLAPYPINLSSWGGNGNYGIAPPYMNFNLQNNYSQLWQLSQQLAQQYNAQLPPGATPFVGWNPLINRAGNVPGTYFLPGDLTSNSETTNAIYGRLDFGNEGTGFLEDVVKISGNVGLRIVRTQDASEGQITYTDPMYMFNNSSYSWNQGLGVQQNIAGFCAATGNKYNAYCNASAAQQQAVLNYLTGQSSATPANNTFTRYLPSLNLTFNWTDDFLTRLAVSRAMYRPQLSQLTNNFNIGFYTPPNAAANTVSPLQLGVNNGGQNPYLVPTMSTNADLTAEYYFGSASMVSATVFYKSLTDLPAAYGGLTETHNLVNPANGQTLPVVYQVLGVGHNTVPISGIELTYQQKFTFLPGWLSGFGITSNFTYINLPEGKIAGEQGDNTLQGLWTVNYNVMPFEGAARDSGNLAIYYDRDPWSARLAYTYTSSVLLTHYEVNSPNLPAKAYPYSQLDGSISYKLNDYVKVAFDASNLLNSTQRTGENVNSTGLWVTNFWIRSGRRYVASLTAQF
jgi:TonB-dependent receptor